MGHQVYQIKFKHQEQEIKVKLTQMLEVLTCMVVWEILNNAGKSAYNIWENGGVICKRANAVHITAYSYEKYL